jgi:hypothetical protein
MQQNSDITHEIDCGEFDLGPMRMAMNRYCGQLAMEVIQSLTSLTAWSSTT